MKRCYFELPPSMGRLAQCGVPSLLPELAEICAHRVALRLLRFRNFLHLCFVFSRSPFRASLFAFHLSFACCCLVPSAARSAPCVQSCQGPLRFKEAGTLLVGKAFSKTAWNFSSWGRLSGARWPAVIKADFWTTRLSIFNCFSSPCASPIYFESGSGYKFEVQSKNMSSFKNTNDLGRSALQLFNDLLSVVCFSYACAKS